MCYTTGRTQLTSRLPRARGQSTPPPNFAILVATTLLYLLPCQLRSSPPPAAHPRTCFQPSRQRCFPSFLCIRRPRLLHNSFGKFATYVNNYLNVNISRQTLQTYILSYTKIVFDNREALRLERCFSVREPAGLNLTDIGPDYRNSLRLYRTLDRARYT